MYINILLFFTSMSETNVIRRRSFAHKSFYLKQSIYHVYNPLNYTCSVEDLRVNRANLYTNFDANRFFLLKFNQILKYLFKYSISMKNVKTSRYNEL